MRVESKLLSLVLLLNLVRYVAGYPLERLLIFEGLGTAMSESRQFFHTGFTTFDWATSYFYNFVMWATCVWVFYLAQSQVKGALLVRSLKIFALMWLFFASVSAIYMNHYAHPKAFYLWSIADAALVFALVGATNGLLFPYFFPATPARE